MLSPAKARGKSTAVVVFDIWIAALCDHRGTLAPGETGVALLISRDQRVARMLLDRIYGIMSSSEPLNSMIVNRTADTIELRNGISIEVRPCSYKTLRGPTFISVICDELAFWFTSADFANPDTEVLTAVRPGLITTDGPVLMVSSAYAKRGELYEAYRKYFGPNGAPDVLVAYGTSRDTSIPLSRKPRLIARSRKTQSGIAQNFCQNFGMISQASFRARSWRLASAIIMNCRPIRAFATVASWTLPLACPRATAMPSPSRHKLGDRVVIDAIREVRPPFSPSEVVSSVLLPMCKAYNISSVTGDNYAGEYPKALIRTIGISYDLAKKHKTDLYVDPFLPLLNSRKIDLPRNERAIAQICSLERSMQRSGREQISHPTHGHDDVANAIAGAADVAYNYTLFDTSWSFVDGAV